MKATPGIQTLLRRTLPDGLTTMYPRAFVYNPAGGLDDTVDLATVGNGMYEGNWTPPLDVVGLYTSVTIVYSDPGHTTPAAYDVLQENIDVEIHFECAAVWVDEYGIGNDANPGTEMYPVSSLSRAKAVAVAFGLQNIRILSCGQSLTEAFTWYYISGNRDFTGSRNYIDLNGQELYSTNFENVVLTGSPLINSVIGGYHCYFFATMTNVGGGFQDCGFLMGPTDSMTFLPGTATTFRRSGNSSGVDGPLYGVCNFSFPGVASNVQFSAWYGRMKIFDMDDADSRVRVDATSGEVEVDVSNINGVITISGNAKVINNSGGAIVVDLTAGTGISLNTAISESGTDIKITAWWSRNGEIETGLFTTVTAKIKDSSGAEVLDLLSATETGGRFAWTGSIAGVTVGDGYSLEVTADGEVFAMPFTRN